MSDNINLGRRRFLGAAAGTLAAAQWLWPVRPVHSPATPNPRPRSSRDAHVVRPDEADRRRRPQCRLRRSRPRRRSAGHPAARLALRHLRLRRCRADPGVGRLPGDRAASARLRHHAVSFRDTLRNGQQAALAVDVIDLMDALKIEKAVIAGFDWGARTADIVAALWPRAGARRWSRSAAI